MTFPIQKFVKFRLDITLLRKTEFVRKYIVEAHVAIDLDIFTMENICMETSWSAATSIIDCRWNSNPIVRLYCKAYEKYHLANWD